MSIRRLWIFSLPLLLTACATTPVPLQGVFTDVSPEQVQGAPARHSGVRVRWGGEIADVTPGKDQTCFTVLGRPLDDTGRPERGDKTLGRFIACSDGFYDPAVYARKRDVTVVGTVVGTETKKIGEYSYHYPKVEATKVYLWPKQAYTANYPYAYPYYYPYSYYPFGGPFYSPFCGPFYGPWGCSPYWW